MLVDFAADQVPGFGFVALQQEPSRLLHRMVDLHPPRSRSPLFREDVMQQARLLYGERPEPQIPGR